MVGKSVEKMEKLLEFDPTIIIEKIRCFFIMMVGFHSNILGIEFGLEIDIGLCLNLWMSESL